MPDLPHLIRIELLKLRTTGTPYVLAGSAVALTALNAVLRSSRAGNHHIPALDTAAGQTTIATLTGFAILMSLTLGATTATGEFRHATATFTYLQFPHRTSVMLAKMITAAVAGAIVGALGAAVATGIGLAYAITNGNSVVAPAGTLTRDGIGAVLGAALLAMLGAVIGSLFRSQLAVTIGGLVWGLFVESIVGGLYNWLGPYLPFTAATTLGGAPLGSGGLGFAATSDATALPFAAATALLAALILALAVTAARTTVRADIS